MVGKVDVREKREGGAVGAKGRAGGNRTRALAGEAVAGGSAAAAEAERRRGVYASSGIWLVGGEPFLRVSSRPVLHAGRDGRSSSARRRESRPQLEAPPRLSLNCRLV